MPLNEVRREFESLFGIHATLSDMKENLIDRMLAKLRAELRRKIHNHATCGSSGQSRGARILQVRTSTLLRPRSAVFGQQ